MDFLATSHFSGGVVPPPPPPLRKKNSEKRFHSQIPIFYLSRTLKTMKLKDSIFQNFAHVSQVQFLEKYSIATDTIANSYSTRSDNLYY